MSTEPFFKASQDSAYDDFFNRFGDKDPNKRMTQSVGFKGESFKPMQTLDFGVLSGSQTEGEQAKPINKANQGKVDFSFMNGKPSEVKTSQMPAIDVGEVTKGMEGLLSPETDVASKGGPGIGAYADAAIGAVGLVSMAKGDTFNTSADSGGVGSAGSAAFSGAAQGAQAGMAFGPLVAGIGGAVGAGAGLIGHNQAKHEYNANVYNQNQSLDSIERLENDEAWRMKNGEESMGLLKGLREKQLGIIKT